MFHKVAQLKCRRKCPLIVSPTKHSVFLLICLVLISKMIFDYYAILILIEFK